MARRPLATRQALLLKDAVLKGRTERAGAVVTVAGGHLRNYLYPRGVAVPATPENLARYEDLAASEAPAPAEAPKRPRHGGGQASRAKGRYMRRYRGDIGEI